MIDTKTDTKKLILDIAEDLLLDRGYNGFSYKYIATSLNIKNASIHYHFPAKTDLGVAIIQRATKRFERWAGYIDGKDLPYSKKLDEFFLLFKRFCEAKSADLPGRRAGNRFQDPARGNAGRNPPFLFPVRFRGWKIFWPRAGKKEIFNFPGTAKDQALLMIACVQGIIQIVRVTTPSSFDEAVKQIKRYVCA